MKTSEILDAAADLMAKPNGWTRFYVARDKDGNSCEFGNEAVSFCAVGAVNQAVRNHRGGGSGFHLDSFLDPIREHIGSDSVGVWNDHRCADQDEVVQTFRAVAAKQRELGD